MTSTMRTPTRDEVIAATREMIREEFGRGQDETVRRDLDNELDGHFGESTEITSIPGAESARAMRVAASLESRFGRTIIRKDAEPARTVGQLVDMVLTAPAGM